MSKQKKPHRRLDPDEVLEGRARPDARELLALIHEVNPSGHEHLPAREIARRYAQKSRLQSLLVRRFPEEILVEPADEHGVIGLRHRASGEDACHAVLASLDEDARSWAQRQLDLGGGDEDEAPGDLTLTPREERRSHGPPSGAPLDAFSTEELLRRGKAALEAYDYVVARERFEAAFERGNQEAARLLLTVLVEHLGLDEDALAVEERLADETRRSRDVRVLLALSAARLYQRPRAIELARGSAGDAAAEVFVALARGALERGELEEAAGDVAEVKRCGPSHPALLGLADALGKRRAEERAPLEAEAQGLLDEGRYAEAEARAAAIVARWPESAVAHAVTRAGQERRRLDEARALAAEGQEATVQGENGRAVGLLRRALTLGLRGEDAVQAEKALAWAEAAERAREARARAHQVVRMLREGHLLRGLTDYVALEDVGRTEVKSRVTPAETLEMLDALEVHGTGPEAKAAVQAVMALNSAVKSLSGDPARAEALVTQHYPLLQRFEVARRCLALAVKQRQLNAENEANQRFSAAMEVASKGAVTHNRALMVRALELFAQVRRSDLDPEGQVELDSLLLHTRRMVERWDRALVIGKLRKSSAFAAARDALDGLIRFEEGNDPDEPSSLSAWRQQRVAVIDQLARSTSLRPSGAPAADALLGAEAPRLLDVPQSLLPGGDELVLAEAHAGVIFLMLVDVATGRVTGRTTLRLNEPFEVRRVSQRAGRVVLLGAPGAFVEVIPRPWELGRAIGLKAGDIFAEDIVLAPGGRFAWCSVGKDGWWTAVAVEDLEQETRDKTHSESVVWLNVRPLHGLAEPRVALARERGPLRVCESRGPVVAAAQETPGVLLRSVTAHPGGQGLFALLPRGEAEAPRVCWAELGPDGALRPAPEGEDRTLEGIDPLGPCETAVSLDARVVYVLCTRIGAPHARRLIGFEARDHGLARCFDVEVPARVTLAQDLAARTVVAVSPHEQGFEVVRLGASPPVFRAAAPETPPLDLASLDLTPSRPCTPDELLLWKRGGEGGWQSGIEVLQHNDVGVRKELIAAMVEPERRALLVPRLAALWKVPKPALAEELTAAALERYPGDPELAQIPAQRAAIAGDWEAVRDRLAPIDPTPLADAPAQHHDHLLGAALLMTGDADEARRVLRRGAARAGGCCDLSIPLALVGEPSGSPGVRALDHAVRAADACLAAGDPGGARNALSSLAVREAREVQTLARLARAWLQEPDEKTPEGAALDGFVRRLALTRFVVAHAEKAPTRRRELPFPGARWDGAQLDALAREVQAWLVEDKKVRQVGT